MNSRILPTLALMVAVGIFLAYVNPTWSSKIAATKAAIAADEKALLAATEYTSQQNALAAERSAIDPASLARLTNFLPDSVNNVGLILDLNALAARSGLSLANIDVTTNTPSSGASNQGLGVGQSSTIADNPVGSVDLSLSAAGTYAAFKTFLAGIERSERLLDVKDLAVRGSDTGVYTYQMRIRIYWLR